MIIKDNGGKAITAGKAVRGQYYTTKTGIVVMIGNVVDKKVQLDSQLFSREVRVDDKYPLKEVSDADVKRILAYKEAANQSGFKPRVDSATKYALKLTTTTVEKVTTAALYKELPRKEKKYFIKATSNLKLLKELLDVEKSKGRIRKINKRLKQLVR
jgi:hypothetical protein